MDSKERAARSRETQIKKYGSEEAFSSEMSRRAKMRKTVKGGGFRNNPELASKAGFIAGKVRRGEIDGKSSLRRGIEQKEVSVDETE